MIDITWLFYVLCSGSLFASSFLFCGTILAFAFFCLGLRSLCLILLACWYSSFLRIHRRGYCVCKRNQGGLALAQGYNLWKRWCCQLVVNNLLSCFNRVWRWKLLCWLCLIQLGGCLARVALLFCCVLLLLSLAIRVLLPAFNRLVAVSLSFKHKVSVAVSVRRRARVHLQ